MPKVTGINKLKLDYAPEKRQQWVDAAKAFAIFLVVLGHTIPIYGGYESSLYLLINLFHMPFFFMISGVVAAILPCHDIRNLKKRELNLLGPAIFFTILNLFFSPGKDIFFYYNSVWFIVFLALILLIDYCIDLIGIKTIYIVPLVSWVIFGACQLVLLSYNKEIYAKFACEISKFCGYLISFKIGKMYYLKRESIKEKKPFFFVIGLICWFVLAYIVFKCGLQDNIALTKIPMGIRGGTSA